MDKFIITPKEAAEVIPNPVLNEISCRQSVTRRKPSYVYVLLALLYLSVAVFTFLGTMWGFPMLVLSLGTLFFAWYFNGVASVTYEYQLDGYTLRILRHSGMRSRPVSVEFVVLDLTRVLVIAGQGASELEEAQRRFDAAGRQRVTYNTSAQDPDRPSAVLFCEGTGTDSGRLVRVYLQPYPQLMDCLRRLCPGKVFVDEL